MTTPPVSSLISNLPVSGALSGAEPVPIDYGLGGPTVHTTTMAIAALAYVAVAALPAAAALTGAEVIGVLQSGNGVRTTVEGLHQFSPTIVVSGPWSLAQTPLAIEAAVSGVGTAFSQPVGGYINVNETVTNTYGGNSIDGLYVGHGFGTGRGNRNAIHGSIVNNHGATPGTPSDGFNFYTAIFGTTSVVGGDGGTAGAYKGDFFGVGSIVELYAAATFIDSAVGAEFDVAVNTGASVNYKIGLQVVTVNTDAVKGSISDAAIAIMGDSTTTAGWDFGLVFGHPGDRWNVSGTLIGTYATTNSRAAVNGIDFSGVTFSSNFLKSTGFTVDGSGNLAASNLRASASFAAMTLNDTARTPTTGGLVRLAGDAGSYIYQINTAVAADFSSAINAITIAATGAVTLGQLLTASLGINVPTGQTYALNGATLLAGQATGYGTPTGGSHQASFAAGAITLANLAAAVAQLIVDLKAGNMPAT